MQTLNSSLSVSNCLMVGNVVGVMRNKGVSGRSMKRLNIGYHSSSCTMNLNMRPIFVIKSFIISGFPDEP